MQRHDQLEGANGRCKLWCLQQWPVVVVLYPQAFRKGFLAICQDVAICWRSSLNIKTWDVYVPHLCAIPFHRHFHPQSLCIFYIVRWEPLKVMCTKNKENFLPNLHEYFPWNTGERDAYWFIIISTHSWVVLHPPYTQNNQVPVLGRALSGSCSSHR